MSLRAKRLVIAGGGTSGWMAAAAFSKKLGELVDVVLVESDEIGTVGVGEATIPPIRTFNKILDIDEKEFMKATQATFKLGIEFTGWGQKKNSYIHSFGKNGKRAWLADFHNFWLYGKEVGLDTDIGEYCFELQAAKANKFGLKGSMDINYAYHLDATAYARYLRKYSENLGVTRVEGKIESVKLRDLDGHIEGLLLEDGQMIDGDFFVDCTGFRGILINEALGVGYEDWSHWLPCDRAIAIQSESGGPPVPYTRSTAHGCGWQWQIPLQHRTGNGLVYSSKYWTDDEALSALKANLPAKSITDPKYLRFQTGRRHKVWEKNCVALGLSSGFLEPLESTSIHLIMVGITRLMYLFPFSGVQPTLVDEYNRQATEEIESIRDFIILHYCATERDDTDFWKYCKNMSIPESLRHKIQLFKESAYIYQKDYELFAVDSWVQVLLGQKVFPQAYHNLPKMMSSEEIKMLLGRVKSSVLGAVEALPNHDEFIDQYCRAG